MRDNSYENARYMWRKLKPKHRVFILSPWARVSHSPWPILLAFSIAGGALSMIIWFWGGCFRYIVYHGVLVLICAWGWARDTIREGTFAGMYTSWVIRGLKWATQLFIFSEVMFFLSFFYAFAHSNVVPSFEWGRQSPPPGIKPIHPRALPFFNLCVLLLSSGFLNVSTGNLRVGEHYECGFYLVLVLILSTFFFWAQWHEYSNACFTICDSCYGTTFYMLTGFHGFHVFVGSVVLLINLWRHSEYHFHSGFNPGWQGGVWYWHFVDLVWVGIFFFVYCWGSWGGTRGYYTYGFRDKDPMYHKCKYLETLSEAQYAAYLAARKASYMEGS